MLRLSECNVQARLRKEYLYRKSLEGVQRAQYEKKRKLREAMAQGSCMCLSTTLQNP